MARRKIGKRGWIPDGAANVRGAVFYQELAESMPGELGCLGAYNEPGSSLPLAERREG